MKSDDDTVEDRTLADQAATLPAPSGSAPTELARDAACETAIDERYEIHEVLGKGGMGEVRLARDVRIDRVVAMKRMRPEQRDTSTIARFVREAKVQGRLEHPAIVPVHDLGTDRDGAPYFVMKKLAGTTLADVLATPELRAKWSRNQLLARLVDICLAVQLAHESGIVHRDIKPANLMLGDFGEAYLLDWGIARILASGVDDSIQPATADASGGTLAGDILGTPGYMSPEQARGEAVDPRSDVFSLGLVLYEILVGKPALPRGMAALVVATTADYHRPSEQAAHVEVPPELDDLCMRATAQRRDARPTARELADGIQAYLDGDRDTERRRSLAAEHAARARAAFVGSGDEARAIAMREAGRALGLDPSNAVAQGVLAHLLIQAPKQIPAAAIAAADEERSRTRQNVLRWASRAYASICAFIAILFVLPIHRRELVVVSAALALATFAIVHRMSRRPMPMRSAWYLIVLAVNTALIVTPGLLFGPLLVMPLFMIGSLAAFLSQPTTYPPWLAVLAHMFPLLLLLALEWLGVLPPTFHIIDGNLVLTAPIIDFTPALTAIVIGLSLVSQFVNTTVSTLADRGAKERAQDRVHAQTWHLEQLLPR